MDRRVISCMLCTLKLTNFLIRTNCHKEAIELGLIRWPNHMGLGVIKLRPLMADLKITAISQASTNNVASHQAHFQFSENT